MDDETKREEAERLLRVRRLLLEADMATRDPARRSQGTTPRRTKRVRTLEQGEAGYEPFAAVESLRGSEGATDANASYEVMDREEQARLVMRGRPRPRAAFWPLLGDTPACGPGQVATARVFHKKIIRALEQGGWTHSEQTQLGNLERRWGQRARGEDARFVLVGNVGGRLLRGTERRIKMLRERGV